MRMAYAHHRWISATILICIATLASGAGQPGVKSAARKDGQTAAIRQPATAVEPAANDLLKSLDRARRAGDRPGMDRLHRELGWTGDGCVGTPVPATDARRVVRTDRLNRSTRWQDDVLVSLVQTDTGRPSLTCGYHLPCYVVAEDLQSNYLDVYRSDDGGNYWYYDFSLHTTFDPTNASAVLGFGGQGNRLLIAYEYGCDTASAAIHVYWLDMDTGEDGLVMVDSGMGVRNPRLCVDADETPYWYAYLTWSSSGIRADRDYGEIMFSRSVSFGTDWSTPVSVASSVSDGNNPDIDFGGTDLYVAYTRSGTNDDRDVWVRPSANWGESWLAELPLAISDDDEYDPSVAANVDGDAVMVAYTRAYSPTNTDVEAYYSVDGGTLWYWTYPAYDDLHEGPADLCASSSPGQIHAAYWRHGDLAYTHADLGFPTMWSTPEVVNEGGAAMHLRPSLDVNPDRAIEECVAWMDDRSPTEYRVYFDAAYPLGDYYMIAGDYNRRIALETLKDWKEQLGYRVHLWTIDDVQDQHPGSDAATALWSFLRNRRFNTRYVLLVGSLPQIPMRMLYPDGDLGDGLGYGSDYYYMQLANPVWDLDGDLRWGEFTQDALNPYPDVLVGRVPNRSRFAVEDWIDNVIAFEQDTGDWKKNVLLAAGFLSQPEEDAGALDLAVAAQIYNRDIFEPAGWPAMRLFDGTGLNPTGEPWDRLLTRLNYAAECGPQAQGLIQCMAHGCETSMVAYRWVADLNNNGICDYGDEKTNIDFSVWLDIPYFPTSAVVYLGGCCTGAIISEDTVFELSGQASLYLIDNTPVDMAVYEYLRYGSPAVIGSTVGTESRPNWNDADDGSSQSLYYYFHQLLVQHGLRVGDAFHGSQIVQWIEHEPQRITRTFNYFGDPSLEFLGNQGRRWQGRALPVERLSEGIWSRPPLPRAEKAPRPRRDGDITLWWREGAIDGSSCVTDIVHGNDGLLYATARMSIDEDHNGGAVVRSADEGATWETLGELPDAWSATCLVQTLWSDWLVGGVAFVDEQFYGVIYASGDQGATWFMVALFPDGIVSDICQLSNGWLLAGTGWNGGILYSVDGGGSWDVAAALGPDIDVRSIVHASSDIVFAACDGAGAAHRVLVSANLTDWFPVGGLEAMTAAHDIVESGGALFVGGRDADGAAVYWGPLDGNPWQPTDSLPGGSTCVRSLTAAGGGVVFAAGKAPPGAYGAEVFAWSPVDSTWTVVGDPLEAVDLVDALHATSEHVYAGCGDIAGTIHKHLLVTPSAVDETATVDPTLSLDLWPNPMRKRATVSFHLPRRTRIDLKIYDVSGRLVRTLSSAITEAGDHAIVWDARDASGRAVPSGIYTFRLMAGDGKVRTGKITVVR
ncbi:MAG: T9SS type A sorting domain-containing protein [Phycisphaerae bacterium]|nr:T9SS type A sorting domain-containing protein [Phycisphaerae bacterium]